MASELSEPVPDPECQLAISAFQDSVRHVKGCISDWKKEQSKGKLENENLKAKLEETNVRLKELETHLSLKTNEFMLADKENQRLQDSLAKVQEENYKLSSDVVHLECKLTSDHDMISRLTENLEERDRHISQLEQKLSSNMEEKMAVINRSKILEENLAMKVKEMSVFSEEREHEKEATKRFLEELSTKYRESVERCDSLSHQLRQERKMIEQFQGRMEDQHSQLKNLTESNNKYRDKILEVCKENKKLKEETKALDEFRRAIKESKKEKRQLEQKLQDSAKRYKELQKKLAVQKSSLITSDEIARGLDRHLAESVKANETLKIENKALKDDLTKANNNLMESKAKREMICNKYSLTETNLKMNMERLEQELQETRKELALKTKEANVLQQQQLAQDFEVRESERKRHQIETLLRLRDEAEEAMRKKNEDLESQIKQLKNHSFRYSPSHPASQLPKQEYRENDFCMRIMSQIRSRKQVFTVQQDNQKEMHRQILKVANLEQQLKERDTDFRASQIEMQYLKEELERLRNNNQNSSKNQPDLKLSNDYN